MRHIQDLPAFCRNMAVVLSLLFVAVCPTACKEFLGEGFSLMRIASSVIYALPLCFFIASIKRGWMFAIIVSAFVLFACIEMLMVVMYGNFITAGNILSVIGTNAAEGGGFIAGNISRLPCIIPILIIGIMPAAMVGLRRFSRPSRAAAACAGRQELYRREMIAGIIVRQCKAR